MIKETGKIQDFHGLRNERLHSLFNTMHTGVIYYDENQEVIDANPAALEILGISRNEVKSITDINYQWDIIYEDGRRVQLKDHPMRVAFRTGKPSECKVLGVYNRKDKKYRWLKIIATPEFKDSSQKPYQVRTCFDDVTEKFNSEKLLKKRNEFTLKFVEHHPSGIVACDESGELIFLNETAKKWHGLDVLDLPQSKWAEQYSLYNSETGALLKTDEIPLVMAYQGKRAKQIPILIKAKGQDPRYVFCSASSMRDEDGNIIGALCIFDDVTYQKDQESKLKKREEELKIKLEQVEESEFFLKEIAKIAKIGGWIMNTNTNELNWTEEVYNIHGVPVGEQPPLDKALDFYVDGARNIVEKILENSIKNKKKFDFQLPFMNVQKEALWVRAIGHPMLDDKDNLIGLKGIFQDITDIRQMKDELEEQQNMYDLLANNIIDILSIFELDGTFRYVTPSIKKILGYEQSDMDGRKFYEFVHPDDKPGLKEFLSNDVLINGSEKTYDVRVINQKGHYRWLEILTSLIYKNGELDCIVASARDITKAVAANKKVARYQKALQKLTNEIVNVEEKEKRRIASNIHDHLSQSLVMAKIKTDKLLKIPEARNNENFLFIQKQITNALDNSRKITSELSPQVLYQLGIIEAIHWLLEGYQDTHSIIFEIQTKLTKVNLSDSSAIILYRCVQELLNNAIKHSNATKIIVEIDKNESYVMVNVIDNGVGFEPHKLDAIYNFSNGGYGIFSISERLGNVGGDFIIQSKRNKGSIMKITMPIS